MVLICVNDFSRTPDYDGAFSRRQNDETCAREEMIEYFWGPNSPWGGGGRMKIQPFYTTVIGRSGNLGFFFQIFPTPCLFIDNIVIASIP